MAELKKTDFIEAGSTNLQVSRAGTFAGITRLAIVYEKIKKGLTFTKSKTGTGPKFYGHVLESKDKPKETPKVSNWPWVLTYSLKKNPKDEKEFLTASISSFFKDADFGGGGKGSGGGAPQTAIVESGSAYYCSLAFNVLGRAIKIADVTDANMKLAETYVDATTSYAKFKTDGPIDWIEEGVYVRTANIIYKNYGGKFKGKVYCHRDSVFMKNIYKAKKVAKDWDTKNDKLAPGSFKDDKWNPGDIWLSTFPPSIEPLKDCKNFNDLKKCVLDFSGHGQYPDTTLLGVSLKKTGDTPKLTAYNDWTDPKDRKHNANGTIVYQGFKFGRKGDFFSSNDIYIQFTGGEMQMRAANTTTSWQGNLLGATAYGGKCGGGNVQFYMNQQSSSIKYADPLLSKAGETDSWSETLAGSVDMKKFHDLYTEYLNKQNFAEAAQFKALPFTEFVTAVKAKDNVNAFKFQKNMGLMFINQLQQMTPRESAIVCTEIVRYAASNTDLSTFFIKVE